MDAVMNKSGMSSGLRFVLAAVALFGLVAHAQGQPLLPSYPTPRLASVVPAGARVGSTVEVSINGADLDGVDSLYFSNARLKTRRITDAVIDPKQKTAPSSVKFEVVVPPDTPLGSYDVRVVGRLGMSNPRTFVISDLHELVEKEPNSDVSDAQPVGIGGAVHGVIGTNLDVDFYSFTGKKGQRIVVHCATSTIDSKSQPQVSVHGPRNREVASGKKPADGDLVLDCLLPLDGEYHVRVCEFTYQGGGADFFYRLAISDGPWIDAAYPPVAASGGSKITLFGKNLPGGQPELKSAFRGRPLEKTTVQLPANVNNGLNLHDRMTPRLSSVEGFSHRVHGAGISNAVFLMSANEPLVMDNEDNDTREKAQSLPIPALVCGKIERPGDRDFYVFEAKQGETYSIEAFADRLQSPLDLNLQLRRLDNGQVIGLYEDHPEIPLAMERFYLATDDPKTKFVVPADGQYELLVRSLMGDLQGGPSHVYCLELRKEQPDFRLVVLSNPDTGAGTALRAGSSHDIQILCLRQDDFKGDVLLSVEGLPPGVSCAPQTIGPLLQQGVLVLTAAASAAEWIGEMRIRGTAVINGVKVTREARSGCLVFPTPANVIAFSRLCRSTPLMVCSKGPFALTAADAEFSLPVGGLVKTKIKVAQLFPELKDKVDVSCVAAPAQSNGKPLAIPKVAVAPGQEGEIKFQLPNNTPPGTYNLVFRGVGKLNAEINKKKLSALFTAATPPIQLHVFDTVATLAIAPQIALKPGAELAFPVKINRLHKYNGEVKVDFVIPPGFNGLTASTATIPPGASEVTLLLKAATTAKPIVNPNFIVRATAKFENIILKDEKKLQLAISPLAAAAAGPATEFKARKLLEEGAVGWKYVAASTVKGDAWRNLDFDDKSWKSAKAPFGNGEPEIQKRGGTEIPEKGVNLVCRRVIDIPADMLKSKNVFVRLNVASDNSAVVFLNGQKVDEETADHEFSYWNRDVAIDANLLRPGRNILAVLLNNPNGSSDAYLDVALTIQVPLLNAKN